ncbi:MAG: sodium-dependent transporter, partial [Zoogloeaceae bacterium]|nr:sodium-dependent transporter [Zoogloeaceae bacterium]
SFSSRSTWSNRWAYILVTIGSSVGLGNIWRFPYIAGTQGGSAFVLVYLICILLVGIPLLMAETLIGRRGRGNPAASMLRVAGESGCSSWWGVLGWTGMLGALLILSYYSVVAGWIVSYLGKLLVGEQITTAAEAAESFSALLASPGELILSHSIFLILTVAVVARGVVAGIERANRVLMPALFIILLLLTLWGGFAGDMRQAWHFMFDFKPEAITGTVILTAMGHAFFSQSLGMGAIMAYGSYLNRQVSIANSSLWVAAAGTLVGLLAGLAIFSLTFGYGLKPSEGSGLILKTLPITFAHMPGGRLFGILFFTLVLFAAWTSAISLVEPFVAWLTERLGIRRPLATWGTGLFTWLVGIGVCLSFNHWRNFLLFGKNLFDFLDFSASCVAMPLTGLAIALFVGWFMKRTAVVEEIALPSSFFSLWFYILRYLVPLAIVMIFARALGWM